MEMEWNAAVENDEIIFETAQDAPSFRGICLGDTIDTVLEKFPCADRELKKQQSPIVYGQEGDAGYASLHLIADSYYSLSFYVDSGKVICMSRYIRSWFAQNQAKLSKEATL